MFNDYPEIVSVGQLCKMLVIGRNTAYKLLKDGQIKSVRIGKTHKILKHTVVEYLMQEMA